jgi:hypothetical protein
VGSGLAEVVEAALAGRDLRVHPQDRPAIARGSPVER